MGFLHALEESSFSAWVLSSGSLFAYPGILFLHTMGMSMVVGLNAGVDLRLLGFAPMVPLPPMKRLFPIMWAGFWVNAASGTILLMVDATTKLTNWDFYVKLVLIVLALVNMRLIRKRVFTDQIDEKSISPATKMLALTSLLFWTGAITAGRLMAYVGPVSGLQGVSH